MLLRKGEYNVLVEALRRRTRFLNDPTGGQVITAQWTGLGSATTYKQAVARGFMECATPLNPGFNAWWRLTTKGALVVAYWIGAGHDYKTIESGHLPLSSIPDSVLQ